MAAGPAVAWKDTLLTAIAPVLWGSTYIVAAEVLPPDRPFIAAVLRCAPAGLLLVLACRRLPARWGRLLVLSILNIGAFQALLFIAAYRLPGGVAAVAGAVQPLLVMALAWAVDAARPAPVAVAAAGLGVVGMAVLLVGPGAAWDPVGMAAALGGAGCVAAGTFLARRWGGDLPVLAFTGWQLLLGGLALVPLALVADPPLASLRATEAMGYAYLCLAGAVLAYTLWFRGIGRLSPVAVTSLALLSPVTAVLLGWVLLGQALTGATLAGAVLVLGSVLAMQWATAPRRAPARLAK